MTRSRRALWTAALVVVAVLIVVRDLSGLDSAPLGAYVDETSIGYNAWAISTHAVDEHGAHLPLYFTAFGEYKNPVYIYTLSALLRVLPLTVATERLPAALFGLLMCLFLTLIAWRRSRSLPVTVLALALLGATPWLTVESRVGFEVISMLAAVSGALWCLSIALDGGRLRWHVAAGGLLAVSVFAYSTGRVAVALLVVALAVAEGAAARRLLRGWLITLVPVASAYALLWAWNLRHPGALIARFNIISITADHAPLTTVIGRFAGNYLTYFGPDFLAIEGDHRARHATQFGGMLLWVTLPLIAAGLVAAWRKRGQPYIRFLVLGTLVAPVAAALTQESVPHALRASLMLPFLLVLAIEGAILVGELVPTWRRVAASGVALALVVQGVLVTVDMYATWPARSALDFDAGEIDAISRASALSNGSQLLLSNTLDQPYIQAAFTVRPGPPLSFTDDSAAQLLSAMNMALVDPAAPLVRPGAIAVLSSGDPVPPGAQRLFDEVTPAASFALGSRPTQYETIVVYRLR
ncbi:MAG: glycosyltransferase family 39 protein [Candidatus Dormibacteraeota bacterium]|nr:glycosyltransferase family 39 protein [Candidatus Dormibacteraeota bacterium]